MRNIVYSARGTKHVRTRSRLFLPASELVPEPTIDDDDSDKRNKDFDPLQPVT